MKAVKKTYVYLRPCNNILKFKCIYILSIYLHKHNQIIINLPQVVCTSIFLYDFPLNDRNPRVNKNSSLVVLLHIKVLHF